MGITLLGLAHYHLGKGFHSLVVAKEDQFLVKTGPYRWIRHPIYTAYMINYLCGGVMAGNVVLTVVPVIMFAIMIATRIGEEEALMQEKFGDEYCQYQEQTGRLFPRFLHKTSTD